jgi:hypothetical protein
MKENDVYRFQYNAEEAQKIFEPHHCFDGKLVVKGGMLIDTYWGLDPRGDMGRRFTEEEAKRKGTLTFVCNLDDVVKIPEYLYEQYEEEDAFNLSHQHGCYKHFVIKRGAKKSVKKQLAILEERVKQVKHEAERAMHVAFATIERSYEQAARLVAGEDVSL